MLDKTVKAKSVDATKAQSADATQLSLDDLVRTLNEKQGQPVKWQAKPGDIGGQLLPILSRGLYKDSLDCIREYVQNPVDANATTVKIKITGNSITITDDGDGMDVETLLQARQLGISQKSRSDNVGFRGIGIYSAYDICNRLIITTKMAKEENSYRLIFDFENMKARLKLEEHDPTLPHVSLVELLSEYSSFTQNTDVKGSHYTMVQLEELNNVHLSEISDHQKLKDYLLQTVPIDFDENFAHKDEINNHLKANVPGYNAVKVKLTTDATTEIIVRPNILGLQLPKYGDITVNGRKVGYYWACLNDTGREVSSVFDLYRGFVYKVKGFRIGGRDRLRSFFTTGKGTLFEWYVGEVFVTDDNVIPNAARNDFEPSPERVQLDAAVGRAMGELNKQASNFQEQFNADKEFKAFKTFLDELERDAHTYNISQRNEMRRKLERNVETLDKKKKKATNTSLAQALLDKGRKFTDILLEHINHPTLPQKMILSEDQSDLVVGEATKPDISSVPSTSTSSIENTATSDTPSNSTNAEAVRPNDNSALNSHQADQNEVDNTLLSQEINKGETENVTAPETQLALELEGITSQPTRSDTNGITDNSSEELSDGSRPLTEQLNSLAPSGTDKAKTIKELFEQADLVIDYNCGKIVDIVENALTSTFGRTSPEYLKLFQEIEENVTFEPTDEVEED